jgi:hypothetical protein
MNKYISHFTPNRIKEEFLFDFISSLGNVKEQIIFRQKFSGNDYNDIISHPTINLSEVQKSNNEDK